RAVRPRGADAPPGSLARYRGDSLRPGQLAAKRDVRGPEPDDRVRPLFAQERGVAVGTAGVQARLHARRTGAAFRQGAAIRLADLVGRGREQGAKDPPGPGRRLVLPDARIGSLLAGLTG